MKFSGLSALLFLFISASVLFAQTPINSAQSGSWGSASTWVGGVIPDSNANVNIALGHLISIDDSLAACKNITFSDTTSQLKMSAASSVLKVYGDFTIAAVNHKAFSSWTTGAKIKFTGYALKQTLSGWNTAGSSTSFMEMVVDKDTGVVTTGRQNMRFSFGNTLDIVKGTFQLDSTDDLESRTIGGTGTEGFITVYSKGIFTMVGGASHIRKGTFTDTVSSRMGKLTVYGKAVLTSTSTNRINFNGIDIMEGGLVNITTGWSSGLFNPNVITVKNGGVLQSSTTVNIYHASAYIILEPGGEFNSGTSTTVLPALGINYSSGTVRFSRSLDQTLPASLTNFTNLYLSGGGIKTLSSNITVNGTFSFRGTAALALGGFTLTYGPNAILQYGASGQTSAQTTSDIEFPAANGPNNVSIYNTGGVTLHANRTIIGTLTLSGGVFDNNGSADDKVLTIADNASIRRASGTFSVAPQFAGLVNLAYISTINLVTTGLEMPASSAALKNLTISSTKGVDLSTNITVNGTLMFESGAATLNTGANTLTLGANASVSGETGTTYIKGKISVTRNAGFGLIDFGGIGVYLNSGTQTLGNVTVERISGPDGITTINGRGSIACKWNFTTGIQPTNGVNLVLSWPSGLDNGKVFSPSLRAKMMRFDGNVWNDIGTPAQVHLSDPRSLIAMTNSLSQFTILDTTVIDDIKDLNLGAEKDFVLYQNYPNPFNPSTTIYYNVPSGGTIDLRVYDILGNEIVTLAHGNTTPGLHQASFNAGGYSSGSYFAVLKAGAQTRTIKMTVIK